MTIDSLLIANRGEIAARIIRTCRRLGIRTVAVYSDADARALHVRLADEARRLGPAPASESYLRGDRIIDIARACGADAVHPGYGFLAESAAFAQACLDAGLAWVGPPPMAMRALGDKASARAVAEGEGVPVLSGYHGPDQATDRLAWHADRIGYPLLIKASAGGGGRGMRVVEERAGFADALDAARREAEASFGDGRVLLERYVARPRHIEVQVLADHFGNAVALGERECSIQRRYQKLIEESPSPAVDPPLRQAMSDAALRLVRAAGYTNAGTVEFLLDENRSFAFLEVNARLQVEHPVTEALTGLDLVEQQLRVASGDRLSFSQADVELRGHAIEARVVAEDPAAGFLPSTGRLEVFEPPAGLRVDSSVEAGSFVSPYYDSLLAKVVAIAEDRLTALRRLSDGLAEMMVEGVASNLDLLLATVEHPAFVAGELRTGFLAEHGLVESLSEVPPEVAAAAAAVEVLRRHDASGDPWRTGGAWRLGRLEQPSRLLVAGSTAEVFVTRDLCDEQSVVRVGDRRMALDAVTDHGVRIGGELAEVRPRSVVWRGRTYRVRPAPGLEIEQLAHHGSGGAAGGLTAPMPARVVKLAVAEGEEVRANQPLVVLEAMKMEHVVEAPHAGVVRQLCVAAGQQVAAGALLLELAELE